jgi:hypothetical protein
MDDVEHQGSAARSEVADGPSAEERAAVNARRHRASMEALGLKPFDPPLPDPGDPEFQAQVRRACEIINATESEEDKAFLEALSNIEIEGWVYDWD